MSRKILLALLLCLAPPGVEATGVSGRFSTALYSLERAVQDTTPSSSARVYQAGRLKLTGIADRPELSFRTYGRISKDLAGDPSSDPVYRLYHAYLRWSDGRDRYTVQFGRQTVFSGAGVGRIDGLRVKVSPADRVRFDLYGGALVTGGHEGVRSPGTASMVGGRLVLEDVLETTVGLSAFRRSRKVAPYESAPAAEREPVEIRPGDVEQQMFGLDARRVAGHTTLRARWAVSTPQGWTTRRFEGSARYARAGWTVTAIFEYRRPYIDENSPFAVFARGANREAAARLSRRFNRHFGLFAEIARVDYDEDVAYRMNLGVTVLNGYIGYARRTGYAGSSDGLNGVIRHRLTSHLWASASLGLTEFRTYSGSGARSRVLANTLGLNYRPWKRLTVSVQGQRLSQDLQPTAADRFAGTRRDYRLFLSASTWFFHKGGGR